jgi:signal transduction histidine kinase
VKKILLLFLCSLTLLANTHGDTLEFTDKEQAWIDRKIPITYVYDIDWAPFEWKNEVNRHTGIISDILNLIAKKSNLQFEAIHTNSWATAVMLAENGKVDMYSAIPYSTQRARYMNFTTSDIFQYNACFVKHTHDTTTYVNLQEELKQKTVAIIKSSSLGNSVKEKYPQAQYVELEKTEDGFIELEKGSVDLFIINSATADYMINTKGYNNLKIARKLDHLYKLKIAVAKGMPQEVLSIIDKTMAHIDKRDIDHIYNKWTTPVYSTGSIDWEIILYLVSLALLAILFLIYRQYLLREANKNLETLVQERTNDLEDSRNKLKTINATLEERIIEEVEKNRLQDQQLVQQSKMAQMGEMISMIAHQWRQPLNIISLNTAKLETGILLNMKISHEELSEVTSEINKQSQYLSDTIDDFRYFYKPDKESITVTLDEIVIKSLSIIEASLVDASIEIIEEYKSQEAIKLYGNEIMQVILNILKNAQDNFQRKMVEKPRIKITTEDRTITICDNGGGIAEEIIEKIFDPYFSTKDEKNVTGLGLYMSKTIIEKHHGGKFYAENRNDGVCFIIEI